MLHHRRPFDRYTGVTLVELLVVITIMVLLLGVVLPLVQPSLEGRNIREAARQVSTFLMSAQARAISTGRTVGVVLIRDSINANLAYQLKLAETPAPYAGDTVSAVAIFDTTIPNRVYLGPTATDVNPIIANRLVAAGDLIKFNYRGRKHTISQIGNNGTLFYVDVVSQDGSPLLATNGPFQIYRSPRITASPPLELPSDACIDLSLSGIEPTGTFTTDTTLSDRIMLTFEPDGSVGAIYVSWDADFNNEPDTWMRCQDGIPAGCPYGPTIFLLVGRPGQVVDPDNAYFDDPPAPPLDTTFPTSLISDELEDRDGNRIGDFLESGDANNLQDDGALWVAIDTRMGNVSTAANNAVVVPSPLGPNDDYRLPFAVAIARQYALQRLTVGGN
jgi:type II secretory pathway pseudopilin PulG